jgi:hypothetical protein
MNTATRSAFLCGGFAAVASFLSIVALAAGKPVAAVGAAGVGFAAWFGFVTVRTVG